MFSFFKKNKSDRLVPEEWLDHDLMRVNYLVIDCEMTGLNPKKDKLLSIGAVRIKDGVICMEDSFYQTIYQNSKYLKNKTIEINQLSHDEVSHGRMEQDVIKEFKEFVGDSISLGHFFRIDLNFLEPAMGEKFAYPSLDTRLITQFLLKRKNPMGDYKDQLQLTRLAHQFDLPQFGSHHALSDAMTTACLFLKLSKDLREENIVSLRSLYEIAKVD